MRIEQVDLRIVRLPLVRPFQTSSSRKEHLDHILVRVVAGGVTGWGECASPSDPYYCPETTETCWHILRDFLVPPCSGETGRPSTNWSASMAASRGIGSPGLGWKWHAGTCLARTRGATAACRCWAAPGPRSSRESAWESRRRSKPCSTRSTATSRKATGGSS